MPKLRESTILPGKWVYTTKIDTDGSITQCKARLVICGNRQRRGIDYDERLRDRRRSLRWCLYELSLREPQSPL